MVEVDETRKPASLVLIGHVDAGKSTIFSNLVVDKKTIGEDDKEMTDVRDRAHFDLCSKRYTVFDAPGQKDNLANMI